MLIALPKVQLNAVIKEVGINGAEWRSSRTEARTFQSPYLKYEANTWLVFVKQRLLPTTHDLRVSRDRVLLVFSILRSLNIDVGKSISGEIHGY